MTVPVDLRHGTRLCPAGGSSYFVVRAPRPAPRASHIAHRTSHIAHRASHRHGVRFGPDFISIAASIGPSTSRTDTVITPPMIARWY